MRPVLSAPALSFDRSGSGEPLLLVHANGMSRAAWKPVVGALGGHRDVSAVDRPGHGESPPGPPHIVPAPAGFAHLLGELLDDLGIERVHVAGNSLGGWTGLELALLGRVRSVVAFGPAGLWRRGPVRPVLMLSAMHRAARRLGRLAPHFLNTEFGRRVALGRAVGQPSRVPPEDAVALVDAFARASSLEATLIATHMRRFEGGHGIDVPVTVVFGQRDRVVPAAARLQDELPAHARWLEPRGLGHVPMWDDPNLVARIILSGQ